MSGTIEIREAKLSIKTKPKKILNSTRWGVDDIDKLNEYDND